MEVKNCKSCKRLFNYLSGPRLCPACAEELEKTFQLVKEYLWENPDATLALVSEKFEVSTAQIKQWIREERLVLSKESPAFLDCENCGEPVKSGRYCNSCKVKLENTLKSVYGKPQQEVRKIKRDGERMRFLDK